MAKGITIKITDNSDYVLDEFEDAVKRALLACGLEAQGKAIDIITAKGAVDTGLLRATIAFALGGESATPQTYRADVYGDGSGSYVGGTAPKDEDGKYTVYLGTNVEYAQEIECGGNGRTARPFLAPAVSNYASKYRTIIKGELEG